MPVTIPDILARSGPLASVLGENFEPRPEQVQMAGAVATAMENHGRLLVEAGTGVGKSFAYLVPAILRAVLNKERVVIATNTIALQEQLVQKDIPLLKGTIEKWGLGTGAAELIPVLVKGRSNYVSIRRLKLASQRQDSLFPDAAALRSLHVIEDWAYSTTDGSRATLPAEALESPDVWDHARSDADNCMGRKCEHYKQCFFQNARREMERANLLVCNHALFFSDLALRTRLGEPAALLPAYHHVVLDEAHNVEEVACEHFGVSLTEPRVLRLLRTLYHPRRRKGYLTERTLALGDAESVERAVHLVLHAESAARSFFESILFRFQRPGSGSASGTLRVREPAIVENHLTPVMRDLALRLKTMKESIKSEQDQFELNSYAKRAGDIADAAEALLDQSVPDAVYWVEVEGGGIGGWGQSGARPRGPRVTLACSPVEAAPILREALFSRKISVTLTSATLATRSAREDEHPEHAEAAFGYVMNQLGCDDARTLQLGSPFDYTSQSELFVDTTLPEPRGPKGAGAGASVEYIRELSARIIQHIQKTDGGAFVLFTSFAHLNAVADEISGPLSRDGIPVLAQGRDGSRSQILEKFRQDEHSVLLGAASFWQGVDVRGRALRNVIITRLPFDPPDRPLTQARLERIEARRGNPFMEESLPRAVIRFKQGFGRLIRSRTDNGRVVVLDPRILTARYGRIFLDALPPGVPINVIEEPPADFGTSDFPTDA